jgi:transcriptional regulator with XRE-family HTH domain
MGLTLSKNRLEWKHRETDKEVRPVKFNPDALRTARVEAGLSRKALAEKSGVSPTTVFYMESGRTPDPRLSNLEKLAKALGVDGSIFFTPTHRKNDKRSA